MVYRPRDDMLFSELQLKSASMEAITFLGFKEPTEIQQKSIPILLDQEVDFIGQAQTGTGKTAAFLLPALDRLASPAEKEGKGPRVLILVPTRELAMQIATQAEKYSKYLQRVKTVCVVGGVPYQKQLVKMKRPYDILIATPGRLIDFIDQGKIKFPRLEMLVLDEADRMLDMGFIEDINKILARLPEQRQNLLFSATMSDAVKSLAKRAINQPVELTVSEDNTQKKNIKQWLVTIDKTNKSALLSHLIHSLAWQQALIFIETKHGAAKLVSQLEKRGIKAESLHGGRTQAVREQILNEFKSGNISFLIATGIAARGIDIGALERVVNYDLPAQVDEYIHRIGRTGRAGASGEAVSFVSKDNFRELCAIESRLGHVIERKSFDEFPVKKVVPISILNYQTQYQKNKQR